MISGSLLPVTLYTTHLINSWVGQRDDENCCWHVNWCWIGDWLFWQLWTWCEKLKFPLPQTTLLQLTLRLIQDTKQKTNLFITKSMKSLTKLWSNLGERSLRLGPVSISAYWWVWRRLRLPRVRFFSPPVSRGQVSGPKMLTCTLGLGQHHVCKYLITPCILYKLYPWNGLYNPSYGTPCIQSLGCLLTSDPATVCL